MPRADGTRSDLVVHIKAAWENVSLAVFKALLQVFKSIFNYTSIRQQLDNISGEQIQYNFLLTSISLPYVTCVYNLDFKTINSE